MSLKRTIASIVFTLCALFMLACGAAQETANVYTKARPSADSGAALMTLKQIANAQQTYFARTGNAYGTFDQLVESGALDPRFTGTSPVVNGYVFTMKVAASTAAKPAYSVNADPQPAGGPATGTRHYFMDASGTIHYNETQPASFSDPVLQ
ncbi:MAG: hypothetical protein ICV60_21390 [Pyrinomonadaceae bacterium]|nr:hypothetical protein [Pyrinomonadaceae bacterium]